MKSIYIRFGLPAIIPKNIEIKIKRIDKAVAWFEAVDIAGYSEIEVLQILKKPRIKTKSKSIISLGPNDVAEKFLNRFQELY